MICLTAKIFKLIIIINYIKKIKIKVVVLTVSSQIDASQLDDRLNLPLENSQLHVIYLYWYNIKYCMCNLFECHLYIGGGGGITVIEVQKTVKL